MQIKVNGVDRSFDGDPEMPLLWYLRDELKLTGTKFGCGIALCGACTVHKNGEAIRSCVTAMRDLEVVQCGYCQPGQIMQAVALLNGKKKPTDQEIDEAMAGNICRCGTYQRIRAAIKTAAEGRV